MTALEKQLSQRTTLKLEYVQNILKLLDEGATIPFIARYRKEMTGSASDDVLREFDEVYQSLQKLLGRKEEVFRLISERATLSDSLKKSINEAQTLREIEDIYRPYKEKKNSRAASAIASGLTSLANILSKAQLSLCEFKNEAKRYVKNDIKSVDDAIKGAQDIIAERYSDNAREREAIFNSMMRFGLIEIKKTKNYHDNSVYKNLVQNSSAEKVAYIPSHRYLAMMRGVKEKELSVKLSIDIERIETNIKQYKIPRNSNSSQTLLFDAYKDGLKRLLLPSIERAVHSELKVKADEVAISTFGKNLDQLLMTPPVLKKIILAVDPAFRTGCKLAVLDEDGNYIGHDLIYPNEPNNDYEGSKKRVLVLVKKYNINAVAIGNATASRETQEFFAKLNTELDTKLVYTVVSEAGASVYSASKLAADEYPNLDVTVRGAISIGQRLRDPMATLVKIDPKSLGIGQYQHDVDQKILQKKLDDVTETIVNRVGVDVNSASVSLLSHIAGLSKKIAQNILDYKSEKGRFQTKSELLKVKGLGPKAYEQAAGFIRIKEGKSEFDNSGIHPESYAIAKQVKNHHDRNTTEMAKELNIGEETLNDIVKELNKPGFDPREELPSIPFKEGLTDIKMLKEGSVVSGVVRNIADFGAFVDIGLKNDGMIHISKMSEKRIKHPLEVLSINQYLPKIEVVGIDLKSEKISLNLVF
jgi:protein Tex